MLLGDDAGAVAEFLKIPERYPGAAHWVGTAYYWRARRVNVWAGKEQAAEYYRKAGGKGTTTQERFAMEKAKAVKKGTGFSSQGPGYTILSEPRTLNPEPDFLC